MVQMMEQLHRRAFEQRFTHCFEKVTAEDPSVQISVALRSPLW